MNVSLIAQSTSSGFKRRLVSGHPRNSANYPINMLFTMSENDVDMVDDFLADLPRPPASRELDHLQYHVTLQEVGRLLQNPGEAAFSNQTRMKYSAVHVLLLYWED